MTENNLPPPLEPHTYPSWIKAFAFLVLLASIYSFTLLPRYLEAAQKTKEARMAFENKDYAGAIRDYGTALYIIPSSKKVKIALAEVYFSNEDAEDDIIGLMELEGVKLDKDDWARISLVMPKKYADQFSTTRE